MRASEILHEVHWTDMYTQPFQELRKKYLALVRANNAYNLYIQFTNHANDTLIKTPHPTPGHADPVGVYGYPMEYVLKWPADVWYARSARYARILRDTSKNCLHIQDFDAVHRAERALYQMGFTDPRGLMAQAQKIYKHQGAKKVAKQFLSVVQMDFSSAPEEGGYGTKRYPVRSGVQQTALFRKAGFDAIRDDGARNTTAVINEREPEQIVFFTRAAFQVVEIFDLRPRGHVRAPVPDSPVFTQPTLTNRQRQARDDTYVPAFSDPSKRERPLVAQLATIMNDRLSEGPEGGDLMGWHYYWTKQGRRIEIEYKRPVSYYDDKKLGEKKHKGDKLSDPHSCSIVIHSELGDVTDHWPATATFKEIADDVRYWWNKLVQTPEPKGWVPQTLSSYHEGVKKKRSDAIHKKIDARNAQVLREFPVLAGHIKAWADHLGLPIIDFQDNDLVKTGWIYDMDTLFTNKIRHQIPKETPHETMVERIGSIIDDIKEDTETLPTAAIFAQVFDQTKALVMPIFDTYATGPDDNNSHWLRLAGSGVFEMANRLSQGKGPHKRHGED